MAEFIPLRCSVNFRLRAGAHPETGRDIIKSVSISGVDPTLHPSSFEAVKNLLDPMFEYPVVDARKSRTDIVE